MQFDSEKYMLNNQGAYVPVENVKEIDKLRDQFVRGIVPKFEAMQQQMADLKEEVFTDIAAFMELSLEQYGVKCGGEKSVRFESYDGMFRIERSMTDYLTFSEEIHAARAIINECLAKWGEESKSSELRSIVEAAFQTDKDGKLSLSAVLMLRRPKIDDPRWGEAMQALNDSLKVQFSKSYVRAFKRDSRGGWQNITLDFAKL